MLASEKGSDDARGGSKDLEAAEEFFFPGHEEDESIGPVKGHSKKVADQDEGVCARSVSPFRSNPSQFNSISQRTDHPERDQERECSRERERERERSKPCKETHRTRNTNTTELKVGKTGVPHKNRGRIRVGGGGKDVVEGLSEDVDGARDVDALGVKVTSKEIDKFALIVDIFDLADDVSHENGV